MYGMYIGCQVPQNQDDYSWEFANLTGLPDLLTGGSSILCTYMPCRRGHRGPRVSRSIIHESAEGRETWTPRPVC